jgi:hypothetical protein
VKSHLLGLIILAIVCAVCASAASAQDEKKVPSSAANDSGNQVPMSGASKLKMPGPEVR